MFKKSSDLKKDLKNQPNGSILKTNQILYVVKRLQAIDLRRKSDSLFMETLMEQLIKQIIEVDKQARKKTDESKQQLAESKIAIAQRVKELEQMYNRSVEEIIALTTQEEDEKMLKQKAQIEEKYAAANRHLDAIYAERKDEWVKELVKLSLAEE